VGLACCLKNPDNTIELSIKLVQLSGRLGIILKI